MTSSQRGSHISEHPDLIEMQRRSEGVLSGPQAVTAEGLLTLAGAYTAISPWVVGFAGTSPTLTANNLILGLIIVAMGLGLTGGPERRGGITWAVVPMGVWVIISLWIVTTSAPSAGVVVSNVIAGAVTVLLGLAIAGMVMSKVRETMTSH